MTRSVTGESRHVGGDIDVDLANEFSRQCKERGYIIGRVLSQFIRWWIAAPEEIQTQLYRARVLSGPELKLLTTPEEVRAYVESLLRERENIHQQEKRNRSHNP